MDPTKRNIRRVQRLAEKAVPLTTVDQMRKLWEKATDDERQAFAVEVMQWVFDQGDITYGAILHKAKTLSVE